MDDDTRGQARRQKGLPPSKAGGRGRGEGAASHRRSTAAHPAPPPLRSVPRSPLPQSARRRPPRGRHAVALPSLSGPGYPRG